MSVNGRARASRSRRAAVALTGRRAGCGGRGGRPCATVVLWPSGDGGEPASQRASGAEIRPAAPVRSLADPVTYPLSKTPRTIPAVREHTPARGPGWRPATGGRVVVGRRRTRRRGAAARRRAEADVRGQRRGPGRGRGAGPRPTGRANPESYTLTVKNGRVRISGPGRRGRLLRHAHAQAGGARRAARRPRASYVTAPAKPQRGFMLDIARKHFTAGLDRGPDPGAGRPEVQPARPALLRRPGLPHRSPTTHPEIVSKRAPHQGAGAARSSTLAASRHITVVPEIDSPGHLGAVIAAHPDLQLRNTQGVASRGSLDISKPASAKIVDDLLNEYAGLFPGALLAPRRRRVPGPDGGEPRGLLPAAGHRRRRTPTARAPAIADLATGWLNDRAAR